MEIPYPSGYPSPGSGSGAGAGTFAGFLERRRQYAGYIDPHVPSEVLLPAPCGHCGKLEDLRRDWDTYSHSDESPPQHQGLTVRDLDGSLADQIDEIAFEGSSCFTCANKIFLETTDWIDGGQHRHDTPLHYAARSGNLRLLFHLLCLLGDRFGNEAQYAMLMLRKLNVHEETALHEAIRLGTSSMFMVGMLMWVDEHLALHPIAGTSPLYLAVSLGHKHIAEMLHSRSGGNLSYSGPDGQNALHAAIHRPYGMVKMLLGWNKDLSKHKDKNGSTPLHYVVSEQSEDWTNISIWDELEKHATWHVLNANPSAAYQRDSNGLLPVHIAALMDRMVAILVLLKRCRGCIGLRDKRGRSFLHIAVRNKVHRMVKYACQGPVFPLILNARDNDGNTALHLAVEVEDLSIFCYLLGNPKVLLDVRNNKNQTPLDLARTKTLTDFSYGLNPENVIYMTLSDAGARHGSFWKDRVQHLCVQNQLSNKKIEENQSEEGDKHDKTEDEKKKEAERQIKEDEERKEANRKKLEDEEKKDSDQMTDSTRTLGIGSVLITTMTFAATFTVPAAVKGGNNSPGGSGVFGTWYFSAFMAATALSFACSLITTLCLMFTGMTMVKLEIRRTYFGVALIFALSSLTSLTVAFLLGLHLVLASVGRPVSDAIFIISPMMLSYVAGDLSTQLRLTYKPLSVRRGPTIVRRLLVRRYLWWLLLQYWPYIVIFSLARKPAA